MALEPLSTAHGSEFHYCRQISVFVENRLGQLLRLTRLFDTAEVRMRAVSVEGSIDCAIVRLLVNDPDTAHEMLSDAGFATTETELIVVELPPGKRGIMRVCEALITGEININYIYPLLPGHHGEACVAIQVDNLGQASSVLAMNNFHVLDQSDL